MCEQLPPCVAPTSTWENFWKINFWWNLFFLDRKKLLNTNQSGFRPIDSCVNQLLTITHEIFYLFGCNPSLDVCLIFLDISKAFDKAWHEGLLYKLKSFGISGILLNLIKHYLTDRSQSVLLNDQCSNWQPILTGVPQGSILGPIFLIYVNDLTDGLKSDILILKFLIYVNDLPDG